MSIGKDRKTRVKICIDGQMLEQVELFRYLCSLIYIVRWALQEGHSEVGLRLQERLLWTKGDCLRVK